MLCRLFKLLIFSNILIGFLGKNLVRLSVLIEIQSYHFYVVLVVISAHIRLETVFGP